MWGTRCTTPRRSAMSSRTASSPSCWRALLRNGRLFITRGLPACDPIMIRQPTRSPRMALRIAAGLIAFGMGCGEGTAPPAPVASVSISPEKVDLVPGGTEILQAVPKDAGGNTLTNRMSEWSTSDASIATVAAGVVTGVAIGTVTITASVEGHTASIEVNVREGAVVSSAGASFSVLNSTVSLEIPAGALTQTRNISVAPTSNFPASDRVVAGTTFDFGPTGATFAQPVTISIKYDPSKVVNSPDSGLRLYEVVGTGWRLVPESSVNTETKTVTGKVSHFSVYGVLLQAPVATVTINRDTTVEVQKTVQFTATLRDVEGLPLNRVVTWTSSNPAAVTIDASGLARTHLPGQSTIAAASEGKTASATVTVVPGAPTALAIVAGEGQTAVAGSAVATPPAVRVTDAFGNPISGFAITFAVASGGGTITGGAATTNASGIATIGNWTLGTTAGPNTLTASGSGLTPASVAFTATGGAGTPTAVAAFAGNNQTGTAGGPVATPPSVKVTDANGNPVAGFNVIFSPGSGNGAVTGGSAVTNSSGIAAPTNWVLGSMPGVQTLVATAGSLSGSPITFSATAVAPIPAKIVSNSLDPQTGTVRKAVGAPPTVRVLDAADIPVPGYTVTFAVTSGGGSVTGATVVTNEGGYATVGSWILGPSSGTNTLTATAGTLQGSPITFTATAVQPPPATMAISAGQNQSALAGTQVPTRPAVIVTDATGDGGPGITVVFSIRSGSGSITGASAVTDASGIATLGSWKLGLGGNSLFASVSGLPGSPLIFNALVTADVQVVTFGDSNTDYGYSGNSFSIVAASYVSNFPSKKLGPNEPNSSFQLAGKIESRWRANRTKSIVVVNHAVGGTTTGTGRTILFSPNAREVVNGVTRFEGEALGMAYPWSGGEAASEYYPSGAIARVQAFTPRPSDFLYISMGTNDLGAGISTASTVVNLEWMVDLWIARGVAANHIIVTTLPPRQPGQSASIPALNAAIRAKFQPKGVNVIDIAGMTSNDDGATWRHPRLHVGDSVHYAEEVRDVIADRIVSILMALTPP